MKGIFMPPRGAVDEPPYRRSCYERWERKMEIPWQKKERRQGLQDQVGTAEEDPNQVIQTWQLLNQQNQKQPGVRTSEDQSFQKKHSTNLKANKV